MPHDEINTSGHIAGPVHLRMWNTDGSWSAPPRDFDNFMKYGYRQLPASTSNPLRVVKHNGVPVFVWRPPAAWFCNRDSWTMGPGEYETARLGHPTVSTAIGQLVNMQYTILKPVPLDPDLEQAVLRETLASMTENNVQFNAAMIQARSTVKLVTNLSTGLARGIEKFHRDVWGKPRAFRKFLANAGDKAIGAAAGKYLEYLYGWKPLADDVENAIATVTRDYSAGARFQLRVSKGHKKRGQHRLNADVAAYWFPNGSWWQDVSVVQKSRCVLFFNFPGDYLQGIPAFTPFGTAWELAPWSFVADWFIPVGSYISALEALQYAAYLDRTVLTSSINMSSDRNLSSSWEPIGPTAGWVVTRKGPAPRISGHSFRMTRRVIPGTEVFGELRLPSFRSRFGLPQAAQGLALLQQVINRWSPALRR